MERFTIGPMCVTKDDFKKELEKNGLKYGYIARLYEKFKQDDMTVFRILIGGIPYTVLTDNESSYPEIQEETGKKVEPYFFVRSRRNLAMFPMSSTSPGENR